MATSKSSKIMRAPEIGNINLHIVKASATITLSSIVDVKSVWRYYKLQASTLSKPNKPTKNPPEGWTTTEPSYTNGSTNSLYFCDLTVFSDDTFVYSDVSLSSSYEAAKTAYNKAIAADNKVDKNKSEILSMGEQLVINGSGLMGDNTNFSSLIFDASKSNGSAGSFTRIGSTNSTEYSDNFFPVSPTIRYSFELDAMSSKEKASMYSFLDFYDVDKKRITADDHMYVENTLTTLAKDLKNGDTVVYLTDMTNWLTSGGNGIYTRGFIFWNYKNSFGYTYPEHTYSKNHYFDLYTDSGINTIAKTITLKKPWTYGTFPSGTKVSQSNSGATFKYQAMGNTIPPSIWKHYSGHYDGTDYSGKNVNTKFPPGTAYAKVGFLWNYNKSDDQVWVTNISVKTDYKHAIDEVATRVTNAETKIEQNSEAITLRATKTEVTEAVDTAIDGISVGGTNLLTNTGDGFKPTGGWSQSGSTWVPEGYYEYWYYEIPKTDPYYETKVGDVVTISFDAEVYVPEGLNSGWLSLYDNNLHASVSIGVDYITFPQNSIPKSTLVKVRGSSTRTLYSKPNTGDIRGIEFYCGYGSGRYFKISRLKIERGNKATDWTPAPEDYTTTVDMNSKIEQTANSIKSEVSEVYQPKGDYATNSSVRSAIEQSASSITSTVSETYATKTSVDTAIQTSKTYTDTELTQTSEEIRFDFNKSITSTSSELQSRIDDNDVATNQKLSEINKYIRFVDGKIILGETGNELMLTIQNNRVSFTQSGVEVAYFSNNKLHINKAEVLTSMKIGNYELAPRTDGGLALRKWRQ